MTVLDNTPRDQYTATGGQVAFSYTFEIAAEGDIAVLQNGVLLSLGAGAGEYAVTGVGSDTGGVVTLVTGATSGDIITLYRDMALERLTSYTNGGDFLAADVNNDYDRLWLALQQNTGTSNRALVAPNTDPTNINMTIPDKATRLGKYLKFNDTTGNPEAGSIAGAYTAAGMNVYNFTGDGTTVNFTLGMEPGGENNTQVYIDGVYQQKDGYNVSGAVVQFSVAPPNLSTIEVMVIEVLPVGATTASQVSFTQAGSTYGRNVQLKLQESVSVKDFGAVGDGVTDDTAAIQAAIDATAVSKYGLIFEAGKNYLVSSPLSFSNSANTVPRWVDFNGCAITASGSFSGTSVVYVENPQGKVDTFWMKNAYIDATGVNYGFYLKGSQDGRYSSLQVVNATSHGFLIQGETGFGIYYNVFDTCKAGASTKGNGGDGFRISGVGGRFANANTFLNCASQFNAEGGFRVGISSGNVFVGCSAEENVADAGFVFGDTVTSVSIVGGFTENNDYSGTDTSFRILSGAAVDNVRISGGRHNGTTNGDFTQDGIMYDTTGVGDVTIWNTDLKIRNLTLGGSGANIVSADATSIRFGDTLNPDANLTYNLGSNALRWTTVFCNDIDQNSTTGGAGSAGAGNQYITLRIDGVNYKLLHDGTV